MHRIEEGRHGLELFISADTTPVATLIDRGNNYDLVFAIRGPRNIDDAREIAYGLLDLVVHFDRMEHVARKFTKR